VWLALAVHKTLLIDSSGDEERAFHNFAGTSWVLFNLVLFHPHNFSLMIGRFSSSISQLLLQFLSYFIWTTFFNYGVRVAVWLR
jgi:hypothetical protein